MMMLIAELCTVLKQRERGMPYPQEDCRRVAHLPSLGCEPVGG